MLRRPQTANAGKFLRTFNRAILAREQVRPAKLASFFCKAKGAAPQAKCATPKVEEKRGQTQNSKALKALYPQHLALLIFRQSVKIPARSAAPLKEK